MSTDYEDHKHQISQIKALQGTAWNLWKFHEDRADAIRSRLWTVGIWLVAVMAGLLVFLFETNAITFQRSFPGVIVENPWSAISISTAGIVLAWMTYLGVRDNTQHIASNFAKANCVWSEEWREVPVPAWANRAATTLTAVAWLFGLAFLAILLISGWFVISGGLAGPAAAQTELGKITLLTVNDVYRIGGVDHGQRGGLARVRSLRKDLQAEDPELLVLHAGDVIYPSLLSRKYDGAQMIDVLNRLDGDPLAFDPRMFVVFGNHEFDKRKLQQAGILTDRVRESQFSWLRSNLSFALDSVGTPLVRGPNLRESSIVEANGVKVGLFGLTIDLAQPAYATAIADPLETARRFSREMRQQGADVLVAVTHLSVEQDKAILRTLGAEGPDLIIGGHEHTKHEESVEGRWVLKADADAVGAWVVRITPRSGEPHLVEPEYRQLAGDTPLPDDDLRQHVAAWHARHNLEFCAEEGEPASCLDEEVGRSATMLVAAEEEIRSCETNFGNWIADRMRAAFPGAQAAFINAGSLRLNQNIPAGRILRRDLEELVEYDNQLIEVPITGKTLREVAANAVKGWPGNGRWLQISGFAFEHRKTANGSMEVKQIELIEPNGTRRPPRDAQMVNVVTTNYLLGSEGDGGNRDDYDMLPKWQTVHEGKIKKSLRRLLEEALRSDDKGIDPPEPAAARRIVQSDPEPPCNTAE